MDCNDTSRTICEIADYLTSEDRIKDYGHPADNFADIAAMWSVILRANITPTQVGLCNVATKICRHLNKEKRDNLIDMAGYAKTLDIIAQYEKEKDYEEDCD
jgi:hypothetical protein